MSLPWRCSDGFMKALSLVQEQVPFTTLDLHLQECLLPSLATSPEVLQNTHLQLSSFHLRSKYPDVMPTDWLLLPATATDTHVRLLQSLGNLLKAAAMCPWWPPAPQFCQILLVLLLKKCLTFQLFQKAFPDWPLTSYSSLIPLLDRSSLLLSWQQEQTCPPPPSPKDTCPRRARSVIVFLSICTGIYCLLYCWP